ncbi:hypothetical protein [Maridesulfovibrio hydrothermalis]|uniref:Uncharacterized protein n=1 Tax=Maridesulfovibrio hydrothermalis AM13 = DSM 14728 TaxID=1121451 RepID=L0R841_9BACT|nr:hypothetical protein [Maridesulfovibrio hydrothermalis]CCO22903.1 conserved exported protein of unknown function [Maridesulfovibrio hydrothermalis AM13 = DSM 14728]
MSFSLGRLLLVSTTATVVGVAAYAVYKAGGVKPAVTKVVRGSVRASNWAGKKYTSAKDEVARLVDEAKSDMANGVKS